MDGVEQDETTVFWLLLHSVLVQLFHTIVSIIGDRPNGSKRENGATNCGGTNTVWAK